jgi:hypothetical protein
VAPVENLGDAGVVDDRQRLPLRLKALHNRVIIEASLDELQCDLPLHGSSLFSKPNLSHAALSQLFQQSVAAADNRLWCGFVRASAGRKRTAPQGVVAGAGAGQIGRPLFRLEVERHAQHVVDFLPAFGSHVRHAASRPAWLTEEECTDLVRWLRKIS